MPAPALSTLSPGVRCGNCLVPQPCRFTNNLGLVWGSCLNPEDALNIFQSEGMDHGFGKRKAVLLTSWWTTTREALNYPCAGDTAGGQAQLRFPPACFAQVYANFWEQSRCTEHESKWAPRCCAYLWFLLRKEHPDVIPMGEAAEASCCIYSFWCSSAWPLLRGKTLSWCRMVLEWR